MCPGWGGGEQGDSTVAGRRKRAAVTYPEGVAAVSAGVQCASFVSRLRGFLVAGNQQSTVVDEPVVETVRRKREKRARKPKRQPRYHVILWDDDDHSYEYVIVMMKKLFGYDVQRGYQIATQVDREGRAICLTTTREHAELKRDQIHAFGKDSLITRCAGSMTASIEPTSEE